MRWYNLQARLTLRKTVNELSNSIDLESTLIRAEALFRRFKRLVEAIDKKQNFPAPRTEPEPEPSSSSSSSPPQGSSRQQQKRTQTKEEQEKNKKKVISPELRKLLSREVEVLPRKVVQKKGAAAAAAAGPF